MHPDEQPTEQNSSSPAAPSEQTANGQAESQPNPPPEKRPGVWKSVELPSGQLAIIMRGKTKDHLKAMRMAQKGGGMDRGRYLTTLISQLVEIDGTPITVDRVEEMDLADYFVLQKTIDELADPPSAGETS